MLQLCKPVKTLNLAVTKTVLVRNDIDSYAVATSIWLTILASYLASYVYSLPSYT